jgi:hypothetical protein
MMIRIRLATIVVTFLLSPCALAQNIWTEYPDEGVELGQGWDAFQGEKVPPRCIANGSEQVNKTQSEFATIGQLYDKEQLMQGLSISIDVQAKALFGSASAKAKYVTSLDVNNETLNITVYSLVVNGSHYLGLPQNTKGSSDRLSALASPGTELPGGTSRENVDTAQSDAAGIYASALRLAPQYEKLWKKNGQLRRYARG